MKALKDAIGYCTTAHPQPAIHGKKPDEIGHDKNARDPFAR